MQTQMQMQLKDARRNTLLLAVTSPLSWTFYRGLISHLHEAGFEPVLLSSPGPALQSASEQEGVASIAVPMEREIAPLKDLISLWKLYRTIRRIRPDIVDASTPKAGLLIAGAAWLARVPCRVYSLHGLRIETATGLKRAVLRWTERIAVACSHRVFCLSPSLRDRAIALNLVPSEKAVLLKNGGFGVDLKQFYPSAASSFESASLRHRLGIPTGVPVVGFVGRFVKDKGVQQLLEAFDQLRQTYPELHLLMVGDFEDGDPVSPDVREYIENTAAIIRPGFVFDTAPYFRLMDVCVLPTHREGFGQVSAEAQASGIPAVTTTATGAVDSVIDGITGIIVPVGDSNALSGAIGKLLGDPVLRTAMGRAGREWMERDFRPQAIWDHRVQLYRDLLAHVAVNRGTTWNKAKESVPIRAEAESRMKVLQVCKTSDASFWAVRQVAELIRNGIDVHVALPSPSGEALTAWQRTGATLHFVDCRLPVKNPAKIAGAVFRTRRLVDAIRPDIIHSHSVTTTLMLRLALGPRHHIPRIFQVPGPLHMEHWHSRGFELALAGHNDFWIASSQFTQHLYEASGVTAEKLFLSYYSAATNAFSTKRTGYLRKKLNIPQNALVIGNINLIYPPKQYLGHRIGLKCHEDVIEAISLVQRVRKDVWGVLLGGTFGTAVAYEEKLRRLAKKKGAGQILMPGKITSDEVALCWPDFDCAVHVPSSENCGGVVEPLLAGIPTIAGEVGGLPEVVQEAVTGRLVPTRNPQLLAEAVLDVLDRTDEYKRMAQRGRQLVSAMFDPERCSHEVLSIYRHVLLNEPRPKSFDPEQFLQSGEQVLAASM
jgi:glycosyltransferase involved in cell wall biosynthesis